MLEDSYKMLAMEQQTECWSIPEKANAEWQFYYTAMEYAKAHQLRLVELRMTWKQQYLRGVMLLTTDST